MIKMVMYPMGIAIFCLAIIPVSLCHDDIDAFMTRDQIQQVFEADVGSVPIHEVIEINLGGRNKRDLLLAGTRITIRAFGKDTELWLHPAERILFGYDTPIYWAKYGPGKPRDVEFIRQNEMMHSLGQLFEDPLHLASLVIGTEDSKRVTVNGHIGKRGLAIKSLPHDVITEYLRNRRSIDDFDSFNSTVCHAVVYKTNENYGLSQSIAGIRKLYNLRRNLNSYEPNDPSRTDSSIDPSNSGCSLSGTSCICRSQAYESKLGHFMEYLLAFWNGVDLMYRTLETPKVRVHISALVIGSEPRGTPYISNNMLNERTLNKTGTYIESFGFFDAIKEFFPFKSYDVAVTMTRLDLGLSDDSVTLGFAFPRGACQMYENAHLMLGVIFVQDNGVFRGVNTAGHELGHSLGLEHDEDQTDCLYTDGYIMAITPKWTKNSTSFSPCSIHKLQQRLDNQKLKCLYNKPQSFGQDMEKLMPGRLKNLEAQCHDYNRGSPCNIEAVDVCVNFYCREWDGVCRETKIAALDGTSCGDVNAVPPKFCLQNRCVHLS